MSWLAQAPAAASPIEGFLGWRPELLAQFRGFYGALWDEQLLDGALLDMLRIRIAQIHGCAAELDIRHAGSGFAEAKRDALVHWRSSELFSTRERVLLAYAEQIPFAHHLIADDDAATVRRELGDDGFVAYSLAVALFDALCRLRMVMQLDGGATHPAMPPASAGGVLR